MVDCPDEGQKRHDHQGTRQWQLRMQRRGGEGTMKEKWTERALIWCQKNYLGIMRMGGAQQGLNSAESSEVEDLNISMNSDGDKDRDRMMNDSGGGEETDPDGSEGASSEDKLGSIGGATTTNGQILSSR